jgi:hypothetical protein
MTMSSPEQRAVMARSKVTSPRRLRAHRAAQRWAETSSLAHVDLAVIENACADAADFLGRDLDLREVAKVCERTVATAVHDREQAEAQAAIAGAREADR